MPSAAVVRFHGTRGSVPTPESANTGCGGNTSCVEVISGAGGSVVLDGGTGIRGVSTVPGAEVHVFLTHFHWDHVQGLPFLRSLDDPAATIRIHGPCQDGLGTRELLGARLAPVWFPVGLEHRAAAVTLHDIDAGGTEAGGVHVSSMRVRHPSSTLAYRVRCGGRVIVYAPDSELAADAGTYAEFCRFAAGADLLIHDAMLTEAEYAARRGWGHSTYEQAVRLAEDAGVRSLRLFHHHPARSDCEAEVLRQRLQAALAERGSRLDVDLAREGEDVRLA